MNRWQRAACVPYLRRWESEISQDARFRVSASSFSSASATVIPYSFPNRLISQNKMLPVSSLDTTSASLLPERLGCPPIFVKNLIFKRIFHTITYLLYMQSRKYIIHSKAKRQRCSIVDSQPAFQDLSALSVWHRGVRNRRRHLRSGAVADVAARCGVTCSESRVTPQGGA